MENSVQSFFEFYLLLLLLLLEKNTLSYGNPSCCIPAGGSVADVCRLARPESGGPGCQGLRPWRLSPPTL